MERDKFPPFDQSAVGAISLRAATRGEIHPITVTTTSKTFKVPTEWKGYLVRIHADGGDIYYQVSNDTGSVAAVLISARSGETDNPIVLTAPAAGGIPIQNGSYLDVQFSRSADTFALIGSVDCCARAHLAES